MCKHNSFWYINNRNISNIHLFDDGFHMLELAGPAKPGGSGGPCHPPTPPFFFKAKKKLITIIVIS